jgi:putative hydrolase of the HAD superfamily
MRTIDAVFFDVGNTLLYAYPSVSEVVRQVLCDQGHEHELGSIDALMPLVDEYYEDRYREDDTFWSDDARTSAVWVGMYSLLFRELGIEEDAAGMARRVYDEFGKPSRWAAYCDVEPAFARLREAGVRIGLISNWDKRLGRIFSGLGLDAYVDVIVSSAEIGIHKPDPRIFEYGLDTLGVEAARAAHVGDHYYADVLGAHAVGMLPVLIDRHEGETPQHRPFVRTLDDLEEAVEEAMS